MGYCGLPVPFLPAVERWSPVDVPESLLITSVACVFDVVWLCGCFDHHRSWCPHASRCLLPGFALVRVFFAVLRAAELPMILMIFGVQT